MGTVRDEVNSANNKADALHQDTVAGQTLLREQGKLLSKLRRQLKRNQSAGNRQLMSSLNKRVIVQRVQHQKLQKQKRQHFKLLKKLQALTNKAYLLDRITAVQAQRLSRSDKRTSDRLMQQTDDVSNLQHQMDTLTAQLALQNQQHQQQIAAQAGRIERLEQQVSAGKEAQSELQSLQSLQTSHDRQLQSLRNQLDAAAEQQSRLEQQVSASDVAQSELARRQVEEGAGLKSQFQLANRVTEDLAAQVKVSYHTLTFDVMCLQALQHVLLLLLFYTAATQVPVLVLAGMLLG